MGPGRAIEQEQHGEPDADEEAGKRVEDEHADESGDGGDEVGSGREAVDPAEPARVEPVEPDQGADVDELDQRGDHDGAERCLGKVLEEAGQEEQRDDREDGDDQPGQLRPGAGGSVDGGLREAAVDDHPARQAGADVGGAQAHELAVRVDLVVVPAAYDFAAPNPSANPISITPTAAAARSR